MPALPVHQHSSSSGLRRDASTPAGPSSVHRSRPTTNGNCGGTCARRSDPDRACRAGKLIEEAVNAEEWTSARRLIKVELRSKPKDHWLLSRLALTYDEQRKHRHSLYWDAMALQVAPYCPLAIWGYAGALDMPGRHGESLTLYRWLLSWGEEELAYGDCGEGIRRARSLIADCHYRIARIWEDKRQWKRGVAEYQRHLSKRKDGCGSIYPIRDVKARYAELLGKARS